MSDEISEQDLMRESLMRSFQQFHRRRSRIQSVVAVSAVSAVLVLLSWYLLAEDARSLRSLSLAELQPSTSGGASMVNGDSLEIPYSHISVKLMTDEELSAELQTEDSEWVLVYVGGEPRVFPSRALQN
jgi:hypothetical protein